MVKSRLIETSVTQKNQKTDTKTQKQPQNPTVFEIVIPWADVQKAYQKRLADLTAKAEIKGFRKGKASMELVEKKIGKSKIYSEVIEDVLPTAYQEEVKKRNLAPMIAPRVKPINIKEDENWRFEITVVIKPEVELGEYKQQIKNAKLKMQSEQEEKKTNIKNIKNSKQTKAELGTANQNRAMGLVFDTLLKIAKVELPQMLVDEEVNLRLTNLIDQVRAMGMTIEQYLQAKKLTNQQIREEYEKTAREMLKLNLALDKVAFEQKFENKDRISRVVEYLLSL